MHGVNMFGTTNVVVRVIVCARRVNIRVWVRKEVGLYIQSKGRGHIAGALGEGLKYCVGILGSSACTNRS